MKIKYLINTMMNRKIKKTRKAVQRLRYNEPSKVKVGFITITHWKPRSKPLTRREVIEQYDIEQYIT